MLNSRLIVTCFITLLLTVMSTAQQQRASQTQVLQQLQQAVIAISRGDLDQANKVLNEILARTPNDADALNLLGVVRAQQQRTAEAEKLFRNALASAPKHVGAHVNLGRLYLTNGRVDDALLLLNTAHQYAPDRPDVNLELARAYEVRGNHKEALGFLEMIPGDARTSDAQILKLKVLLNSQRLEEARALIVQLENADAEAATLAEAALILLRAGMRDDSERVIEFARGRNSNQFEVLYAAGLISGDKKQWKQAEDELESALKLRPDDVDTLRALAHVARAEGQLEKSLAHLVFARRIAPKDPAVLYDFGATALEMNLYLDALSTFVELNRLYPNVPVYHYALGAARLRNGEKMEAVTLLKRYVAERPHDPSGFYLLGAAQHDLKQFADAQVSLEESLKLRSDPDTEYLLALCLSDQGNWKAAIKVLEPLITLVPDHAGARAALGAAYREEGKFAEARVMLERAIELNAKDLRAHYQLGLVYAKLGDTQAARRMFDRADALRGDERSQEVIVLKLVDAPR